MKRPFGERDGFYYAFYYDIVKLNFKQSNAGCSAVAGDIDNS